jgi:hypothetical protein
MSYNIIAVPAFRKELKRLEKDPEQGILLSAGIVIKYVLPLLLKVRAKVVVQE